MKMNLRNQEVSGSESESPPPCPSKWEDWVAELVEGPSSPYETLISFLFKSWIVVTVLAVCLSLYHTEYLAAITGVLSAVIAAIILPAASVWFLYLYPEKIRATLDTPHRDSDGLLDAVVMLVPLGVLMAVMMLPLMIAISFPRASVCLAEWLLPDPKSLHTRIDYISGKAPRYW